MKRFVILVVWFLFSILGLGWYCVCLKDPLFNAPYSTVLTDKNDRLLGARIASDGQWRFPEVNKIPNRYMTALLQFEDSRFYWHPGFDAISLSRAVVNNLKSRKVVSGGSTISMQTIRLSRKRASHNLFDKIYEIILATRLELKYSKYEILKLYANHAPFGGNVVGIGAAGWRYWGYEPQRLSWADAATLAVLPNQPSLIHPGRKRDYLNSKRDRLLYRLMQAGEISTEEYDLGLIEEVPAEPIALPNLIPHLTDFQVGNTAIGERRQTTIDLELQDLTSKKMINYGHFLKGQEIHNAAALIVDIESGSILAYIGNIPGTGKNYAEFVDCIRAPRSTGSILKPILVAGALDAGMVSPKTLLSDIPIMFNGYRPENFHEQYDGLVSVKESLVRSLNIPMVLLLRDFGIEKFRFNLYKQGLTTINRPASHYGLTLILGGAEASLLELCNHYAYWGRVLKNFYQYDGMYNKEDFKSLHFITKKGAVRPTWQRNPITLHAGSIYLTLEMMKSLQRPDEEGKWQLFQSPHSISWKTGTSFGHRDAWSIGLNGKYLVGVWVGNAGGQGRPGCTGIKVAAPLMFQLFDLLPKSQWEEPPWDELIRAPLCTTSGLLPSPACPIDSVWVPENFERMPSCHFHRSIMIDTSRNVRINRSCTTSGSSVQQSWFIPAPLESYYYSRSNPEFIPLPPLAPECKQNEEIVMQFIYPTSATHWKLPQDQHGNIQGLVCKVSHRSPHSTIYWHLDQHYLGTTEFEHEMVIRPRPGRHILTLVDSDGNRIEKIVYII